MLIVVPIGDAFIIAMAEGINMVTVSQFVLGVINEKL